MALKRTSIFGRSDRGWTFIMGRVYALLVVVVVVGGLIGCGDDPVLPGGATCSARFLSYNGRCGDETSALSYIDKVSLPQFADWQTLRQIRDADGPLELRYLNDADLALGRGLHMTEFNGVVSAYVFNFGSAGQTIHNGFEALGQGSSTLAVAMDHDPGRGPHYEVQFYIYQNGVPVTSLNFDSEGAKFSPYACTACHGGTYEPETGLVRDAAFLPLLKESLLFPFLLGPAEEETLRKMNALVRKISPTEGIRMLVDAAYPKDVNQIGATYHINAVPPSWESQSFRYLELVRPYCIACHSAQTTHPFDSAEDLPLSLIRSYACGKDAPMPQAQEMRRQIDFDTAAKNHLDCP